MTEIQKIHHLEQIEKLRIDFNELWDRRLKPVARDFKIKEGKEMAGVYHVTWIAFKEGKIKPPR